MRNEEDLTGRAKEYQSAQIAFGVVGWRDREDHFERGSPIGGAGEKHTLVYVTLGGTNASELRGPDRGRPVVCALSNLVGSKIPRKGTRVVVATPPGMEESPGAPVIIATVEDDGHDNAADGDVVIPAGSGAARVVAKEDGSIALFTTADNTNNGQSVYIRVAKDGFQFVAPWGTVKFDSTGFHVLHSSGASFDLGGIYGLPSPLDQITSYVRMSAATINGRASAVSLGAATPDALVGSTPAIAALNALQTQITALGAAVAAIQADPTHVASATATTAAATALTAGATALATAITQIPKSTSSS